jgi:valyl-tRNA synthetase
MAPIIPFITEEIYQNYFRKTEKEKSIHICNWPEVDKSFKISNSNGFNYFCDLLAKIRQEKSNANKPMNSEIILTLEKNVLKSLVGIENDLKNVANAREIKEGNFNVEFL